jgi:hypothetical protein
LLILCLKQHKFPLEVIRLLKVGIKQQSYFLSFATAHCSELPPNKFG